MNIHIAANHAAKFNMEGTVYTLRRQSDIVTHTADGLSDSGRVGGVQNGCKRSRLGICIIVEIAIQVEGNRTSDHDVSFGCFLEWGRILLLLCAT